MTAGNEGHDDAPEEALVLSGRLEESSFADLMKSLGKSRETALVTLTHEAISKTVHVLEGRIVFGTSTDPDDRLGECMLRDGMIAVAQYDESVKLIRPGRRQGTILVELGYITPGELVKSVKIQVEHIVASLFTWRSGEYRIEIKSFDTRDIIQLNVSTENVIFCGVKHGAGWSQVLRGLGGSMDTVLDRAPDADTRLYKLDLTEDESHLYSLANGRLSVAQICSMSYLHDYATCVTLWGLVCCGVLHVVSTRDAESLFREQVAEFELIEVREGVETFNKALRLACERVAERLESGTRTFLEGALADVLDEHYDVLREVDIQAYEVDPDLVVENLADLDPGQRREMVERALDDLIVAILLKAKREIDAAFEEALAKDVTVLRTAG